MTFSVAHPKTGKSLRPGQPKKVKLDEPCRAVLGMQDNEDSAPEMALFCETPSGKFYRVLVEDGWIDEKRKNDELFSSHTELTFSKNVMIDEATQEIDLDNVPPGLVNNPSNRRLGTVVGDKTVLAVRVLTTDDQTLGFEEDVLRNEVFSTTDTNLRTQISACSFDQLRFMECDNRSGTSVSIVNGVTTVSVNLSTANGHASIRNAASAALIAEFGVLSPEFLADHVMYCLPEASMSGIAYGYLDSWLTV